jgi:hypothetical protein
MLGLEQRDYLDHVFDLEPEVIAIEPESIDWTWGSRATQRL